MSHLDGCGLFLPLIKTGYLRGYVLHSATYNGYEFAKTHLIRLLRSCLQFALKIILKYNSINCSTDGTKQCPVYTYKVRLEFYDRLS